MEAIDRLKVKLKIVDDTKDSILEEYLLEAEDEMKAFLNVATLESRFASKMIDLAKIYYLRDYALEDSSIKSESYSEGGVSESTTYSTDADYDSSIASVLDSVKRYRRVYAKKKAESETE